MAQVSVFGLMGYHETPRCRKIAFLLRMDRCKACNQSDVRIQVMKSHSENEVTCPTKREKENHRLKSAKGGGGDKDMLVFRRLHPTLDSV